MKGKWSDTETEYGYDFWYQPRHNIMVSSQWGAPAAFSKARTCRCSAHRCALRFNSSGHARLPVLYACCCGLSLHQCRMEALCHAAPARSVVSLPRHASRPQGFNPAEVAEAYGDTLTFWDWRERRVVQTIKLGADGLIPLVGLWPRSADLCAKPLYAEGCQHWGVLMRWQWNRSRALCKLSASREGSTSVVAGGQATSHARMPGLFSMHSGAQPAGAHRRSCASCTTRTRRMASAGPRCPPTSSISQRYAPGTCTPLTGGTADERGSAAAAVRTDPQARAQCAQATEPVTQLQSKTFG